MLGVDIGSSYIKLVSLKKHGRQWRLQACAAYRVADEHASDPAHALRAALQLLPAVVNKKLPVAGIALSAVDLLIKSIKLPAGLTDDEVRLALRMEFEQAAGLVSDDICMDYCHCGEHLLAVVCPQALLDKSVAVLSEAGIKPALAGVDALLVADSLSSDIGDGGSGLYVDAGATSILLYCTKARIPVYARRYVMPDRTGCDDDPAGYVLMLRRAVQQFRMFDMLSRPDSIVVYGGAATLAGVQETLRQSFDLPVHRADPFAALQICDTDPAMVSSDLPASAFTLACLLARQEVSCV